MQNEEQMELILHQKGRWKGFKKKVVGEKCTTVHAKHCNPSIGDVNLKTYNESEYLLRNEVIVHVGELVSRTDSEGISSD